MRMLIFCGLRAAIERFDAAGWPIIVGQYSQDQKREIVNAFKADPEGRLVVDRSMLTGWRAPADTFVLFDPSWRYGPNSPESIQAISRVSGLANA